LFKFGNSFKIQKKFRVRNSLKKFQKINVEKENRKEKRKQKRKEKGEKAGENRLTGLAHTVCGGVRRGAGAYLVGI
jgi:hypothetical protein